ncbi:MAG: hypothetical protein IBJ07_14650 [Rhizobiaceae bacterium]|nr:hypothetical protein [Rhizobiaceae bacterium]
MNAPRETTPKKVDVIITICAFRKRARPQFCSTPAALPPGPQDAVQAAWIKKVQTLPAEIAVADLYAGRGFSLAVKAAKNAKARLYVLSAGLGLVPADRHVPTYGLTVSSGHAESVAAKVRGEFDAAAWFSGLLSSPLSDQWDDVVGAASGRILIALTRPYAQMVGESLGTLRPDVLKRLRIFGASLAPVLPAALHPALVPYDARFDAISPGTRADFSQRALHHFVGLVSGNDDQDRDADHAAVVSALDNVTPPARPLRPRRTDAEILELIGVRLQTETGVARILRALRDEEGVACEQARFSRLYQAALTERKLS